MPRPVCIARLIRISNWTLILTNLAVLACMALGFAAGQREVRTALLAPVRHETLILAGAGLMVAAIPVGFLVHGIRRLLDPMRHPIMRTLARHGEPRAVATQVEAEANELTAYVAPTGTRVTRTWVLTPAPIRFGIAPLAEIAWIHCKVGRQRVCGITASARNTLEVWCKDGRRLSLVGKEAILDELTDELIHCVPWIYVGYSAELDRAWRKDRQAVLADLAEREDFVRRAA